ncbi:MAG: hypothetical protein DSY57_05825 [Desulfobulbus sp.]|nr:MAG: hypothetical protein DSY57_05825 [Desulfobulbus sp.]
MFMLDFYVDSARVAIENIKKAFATPMGVFVYSAVTGMIGVVILLFFFSMLLAGSSLATALPAILAFNGACCGYGIVDRGGTDFPRLTMVLVIISLLLLATGYAALGLLVPWESFTGGIRLLISGCLVVGFSFFGTWIARKNKKLQTKS